MENLPSKQQSLATLTAWQQKPLEKFREVQANDFPDLMTATNPMLSTLASVGGNKLPLNVIKLAVLDFLLFIGQTLDARVIDQICELLYAKYKIYRPDHLKLCFDSIKSGKYGKIYGQVNGQYIMECFAKFDLELDEAVQEYNRTKSDEFKKGNFVLSNAPSEILETAKRIGKENAPTRNTVKIESNTDKVHEWIKEFDRIHRETRSSTEAIKRIEYNNETLTLTEFLEVKHNEFNQI